MNQYQLETADLRLENITKRFGNVTAVNNVSLHIPHAKLLTLLGPSGCGKTTILRMIAGLEVPTSGTISLGGDNITHLPPNERKITMVFQSYALFPHMNVYENIASSLARHTVKLIEKAGDREYYNAETGEGVGPDPFRGWSLLGHFFMLEEDLEWDINEIKHENQ